MIQAAWAARNLEATTLSYKQTLHLLDFYHTRENELLIFAKWDQVIETIFSFFAHFTGICKHPISKRFVIRSFKYL